MVHPIKFQAQELQLLPDGQGHQMIERAIALCWEQFYWNTMSQDATRYVKESKDSKENIQGLTNALTKFSQIFVTPNQKAIIIAKVLVVKWFYVYGIPACIHSDKGHSSDNEIMSHLYAMYGVVQSTTTPYNPCGNAPTERLNCTLIGLLKSLPKEQKSNWLLHLPSLVFAYNAMPHDTTGYQPYELMFGCKAPTMDDAWLGLGNYNDNFFAEQVCMG